MKTLTNMISMLSYEITEGDKHIHVKIDVILRATAEPNPGIEPKIAELVRTTRAMLKRMGA